MKQDIWIALRYASLRWAGVWGYSIRWLTTDWRLPVLAVGATAAGTWIVEHTLDLKAGTLFEPWKVLSICAAFLIGWWAWRLRRRIVIQEFVDHIGDQSKGISKGLSTLLAAELARIGRLYQEADEPRPIVTGVGTNKAIDATLKIEDVGEFLKGAVTAESQFSLGPLKIPVGMVALLVGRLVQGPRIVGSIHRNGKSFILLAQLVGSKRPAVWRVDGIKPLVRPLEDGTRGVDDMIAELACRMFTDLTQPGSTVWTAVWAFNEGLRSYRDALPSRKDRKLKLRHAEKQWIRAFTEDANFDLAYYNLGLVYSEWEKPDAAAAAYVEAISRNPKRSPPYYALAKNCHERKDYPSVIHLCERLIAMNPSEISKSELAQAYDLKGLAERMRAPDSSSLSAVIASREKAVVFAWRALCHAKMRVTALEPKSTDVERAIALASMCLLNLAIGYFSRAQQLRDNKKIAAASSYFKTAEKLLRQALFLTPSDANLYFNLGTLYYEQQRYEPSVQAYEAASRIAPFEATIWAHLTLAYDALGNAQRGNAQRANDAWKNFLNFAFTYSAEDLTVVQQTYELVSTEERKQRISDISRLVKELDSFSKQVSQDDEQRAAVVIALQKKLDAGQNADDSVQDADHAWKHSKVAVALANMYLSADPRKAEEYFRSAIKLLSSYPNAIHAAGLGVLLARALANQEKNSEALIQAEMARWDAPLGPFANSQLAEVYFAINELEQAQEAWTDALAVSAEGTQSYIYTRLGHLHLKLALDYRDAGRRNNAMQEAIRYLAQALELTQSSERSDKAEVHYWLGLLHYQLCEYDKALSHFRTANTSMFAPIVTRLHQSLCYLAAKAYDECVEKCRELRNDLELSLKNGKSFGEIVDSESLDDFTLGGCWPRLI